MNPVLQSLETSFQQDLNGDGTTGLKTTIIETDGSTDLVQIADRFFLYAAGTTTGPQLTIGGAPVLAIRGIGRPNTGTAHWEYDYHGQLAYRWPHGVNQRPAIVGNVFRAKPHDGAPAGVVASFIAVKQG